MAKDKRYRIKWVFNGKYYAIETDSPSKKKAREDFKKYNEGKILDVRLCTNKNNHL